MTVRVEACTLFGSQRGDRVEPGGAPRGVHSEHHADRTA